MRRGSEVRQGARQQLRGLQLLFGIGVLVLPFLVWLGRTSGAGCGAVVGFCAGPESWTNSHAVPICVSNGSEVVVHFSGNYVSRARGKLPTAGLLPVFSLQPHGATILQIPGQWDPDTVVLFWDQTSGIGKFCKKQVPRWPMLQNLFAERIGQVEINVKPPHVDHFSSPFKPIQ
ncbi:MAG: hypothetical protein JWM16_3968 [Verrucomicrobiales bacterium]|nr:hypothetical protein [Verrucomicrobiales bacterium]